MPSEHFAGTAAGEDRLCAKMTLPPTTIERAFDLARSGEFPTTEDIRRRLKDEGFLHVDEHFRSPSLRKQLQQLIKGPSGSV